MEIRRAQHARQGGFVFILLLMLMAIASVVIAIAVQRAGVHHAITTRQIQAYRQHHEMLGLRDYCENWLTRRENDARTLSAMAAAGTIAHRFALDDGTVVLISIQDGQGAVLRNLANVKHPDARRWLVEMLSRLPGDRPDLTRRSGSHLISLTAAPDEVLNALAGFDPRTADALRAARDAGVRSSVEFQMAMERRGVEPMVVQAVFKNLIFEPELWRLNVESVHPDGIARYTLLAEKRANLVKLHEWRPVTDAEAARTFTALLTP